MTDFYKTLGVPETASEADIKKAYKQLAVKFHPDKNQGNKASEEKFKTINEAYDTLKDSSKKNEYDQIRQYEKMGGQRGGFGGFHQSGGHRTMHPQDFNDIFAQAFGQRSPFANGFQQRPQNKDINIEYRITLEEAFTGKTVKTTFSLPSGEKKAVEVAIPAGIENGTRIKYVGGGCNDVPNTPAGNLFFRVIIDQHFMFKREAQHLFSKISVDAIDAMLGTKLSFQNIDKSHINVTIPAGTQPGQQLRCKSKGFAINGMKARGDLFLEVSIIVPKALTPEEESLLRKVRNIRKNA